MSHPVNTPGTPSPASLNRLPRRLADAATLRAHRLACRWDVTPQEFGRDAPVDEDDPQAVRREWLRQLRLWAAYNPEQVFALQVGAGLLLLLLAGLWIMIAAIG